VGALERAACLSLQEYQTGIRRSIADCVQALFRYGLTVTLYNGDSENFVNMSQTDHNYVFSLLHLHFNSQNFTHQLMHFYV